MRSPKITGWKVCSMATGQTSSANEDHVLGSKALEQVWTLSEDCSVKSSIKEKHLNM